VFVMGGAGHKAGLIVNSLQQRLRQAHASTLLRLPIWPDIGPVPTLLDVENKLLSQARSGKRSGISPNVRRSLTAANPTLALPGALHFVTEEGDLRTLLKAKGTERVVGLFEGPESAAITGESFARFAATLSEFCSAMEIDHLVIAIEARERFGAELARFIQKLQTACSGPILIIAAERPSRALATRVRAEIPALSRDESDAVVALFGLPKALSRVVWACAHGHPLNSMLACGIAAKGEAIPEQDATTRALVRKQWFSLDPLSRRLLGALAVLNIDVTADSLAELVGASVGACEQSLLYLVSCGTADRISLVGDGEPSYAIEPAVREDAINAAGEEALELASRAGYWSLSRVSMAPYDNPRDVSRCASYFRVSHRDAAIVDATLAASPLMLSWGEATQLRKNLDLARHAESVGRRSAYINYFLGLAEAAVGKYRDAQRHFLLAFAALEEQDETLGLSVVLRHALARSYDRMGRSDEAISIMRRAVAVAKTDALRTEFPGLLATSLGNLGLLLRKAGSLLDAQAAYQAALDIDQEMGNILGMAEDHRSLALIHQDLGDPAEAISHHERALDLDISGSSLAGGAIDHANLGAIHLALGHKEQAEQHLGSALQLFRRLGAESEARAVEGLLREMVVGENPREGN